MSFHPGVIAASIRRAAGGGGGPPGPVAAAYWRLRMPWSSHNLILQVAEIEMRAAQGGADQCSGGVASASGGTAANAFDNSSGTHCQTGGGFDEWVQYQFAAPVEVTEISVRCPNALYVPHVISLQYSNDGTDWAEWAHWGPSLNWSDGETKVLNGANCNIVPAGQSPFWRVNVTANNGNTNLEITEVEFRGSAGGANLATGGASVGRHGSGSWTASNAFDGELNADAAVVSMSNAPVWLGYMFPSNVAIAEAAVRADTSRTTAPKDFTIDYSNDWGLSWTTVHSATDNIDWASEESRLFDLTEAASSGVAGDWHIDMSRVASGWQVSNRAASAENVAGGDNDPGFVLSNKTLGQTLPRYFEVVIEARGAAANAGYIGIVEDSQRAFYQAAYIGARPDCFGYRENGEIWEGNGSLASGLPTYGAGDIIMVAYDPGLNTVEFGKNGTWQGVTYATLAAASYYAAIGLRDQGDRATLVGNAADFTYAPPPGFHDLAA